MSFNNNDMTIIIYCTILKNVNDRLLIEQYAKLLIIPSKYHRKLFDVLFFLADPTF